MPIKVIRGLNTYVCTKMLVCSISVYESKCEVSVFTTVYAVYI